MLGDIFLGLKRFLHQHFFCIHHYKWIVRKDYGGSDFKICEKCEKIL
jgi:hypothetical protein